MAGKREAGRTAAVPPGPLDPVAAFELLRAELAGDEETPEVGYFTVEQWALKVGKSSSQTSTLLRKFVQAGRADRRKYRIKTGDKVYPVPHYKLHAQTHLAA